MEYLLREDAPFDSKLWERIDSHVVQVAREQLTGRRFLHIYGPLGSGIQSINIDKLSFNHDTAVDLLGYEETDAIKAENRVFAAIPMLYKDFLISWRDIETEKQTGLPVDLGPASAAAFALSKKEDDIIFNGNAAFGYQGLLGLEGRQVIKKADWKEGDNPFLDVAAGLEMLVSKGIYGPYALITSPDQFLQMQRLQQGTGLLIIDRVKELVGGRVYQSPVIPKGKAVLVACAPHNMDLVIGQDMITGYIGPEKMNHAFRILETVLLRVKRHSAVITFE